MSAMFSLVGTCIGMTKPSVESWRTKKWRSSICLVLLDVREGSSHRERAPVLSISSGVLGKHVEEVEEEAGAS